MTLGLRVGMIRGGLNGILYVGQITVFPSRNRCTVRLGFQPAEAQLTNLQPSGPFVNDASDSVGLINVLASRYG
jgi:hypothetical protein